MRFAVRRPFQISALIGAVAIFAAACTMKQASAPPPGGVANAACPTPQNMPTGFDYPQKAATVEGWVTSADVARTRQHGWNLWAGLNAVVGGKPVWQSWCTETQAFAPDPSVAATIGKTEPAVATVPMRQFKLHNGSTAGADPINFPVSPTYAVPQPVVNRYKGTPCLQGTTPANYALSNGPTLQNNGDVMVAGVIYNQPAYDWIRKNKLYLQSTLNGQIPPPDQTRQMAAMPDGSIVLKPMMWPVAAGGFTALPIWDNPASDDGVYAGFEIQKKWPRAVALTTTPAAQVIPSSVTFLHGVTMNGQPLGPNTYARPRVVGVNRFYNYKPDLSTMAQCDRAILDASAYYAYGRMFQQGDYLVLIAMHIMTKEQPAWTFQSVWWDDAASTSPYAADRPNLPPSQAPGPWRNYLMAATYGIPASPGSTQWPVAFNPYIELAADHPIKTNCMNCHHRAAWPASSTEYEAPGGPGALDIFALNNAILNGKIGVDSLWSISDRALASSQRAEAVAARK